MSNQFDTTINKALGPFVKDNYLADLANILIIIFATKIIPPLPDSITTPLNNYFFRILAVFVIAWLRNRNATRSIIISIFFVAGINLLSGRGPFEDPVEGYGLLGNIHDPDIYYMKNRAKHEADFRDRSLDRRNPNRVHAIVKENNKHAKSILENDSDEHSMAIGQTGIPYTLDSMDEIYY